LPWREQGEKRAARRSRYQRISGKSKQNFEVIGGREVAVRLPLVQVWEELQAQVERVAGEAGLRIVPGIWKEEVRQRAGPPSRCA